jgi:hypothetical protein
LEGLQSGKLKIKHEHERLEVIADRVVVGILIDSVFLGSSMLLCQGFPPLVSGISEIGTLGYLCSFVMMVKFLWSQKQKRINIHWTGRQSLQFQIIY